jgi:outer membrane receptor for ferrienterochelin and colicins
MFLLPKTSLIIALVLLARPAVAGQAQAPHCAAEGVVTDSTGLPLPAAFVTLRDEVVVADSAGRFCVASLEPGTHTLTATFSGFKPQPLTVQIRPGTTPSIKFRLEPEFSDRIVVTGTRTGKRIDDVPVRTELVDRDAIDRLGARTLADSVEFTTGVRVESNCQNCNFSQIRLLGLQGPYTQILIDSQPVVSSLAQVYGIEQLPARMIERIEVVKGGGSALYGAGSVGGVVNVISREPGQSGGVAETRTELLGGIPSYFFNGAADWVDAGRQTFVTAFVQTDRVKPVDVTGDGFTEVSRRNLDTIGARFARYLLANRAKLTLDATRMTEDRRGGNYLRLAPHHADIAEEILTERRAGSGTWFHSISPRFDYRATFAVAAVTRDSYYGAGRDPNAYGTTENLLGLYDSQLNHYVRRHTVSWGLQASSETLDDGQPAYDRFLTAAYRNVALFLQDDWAFAPRWQVVYGLRADRHSEVGRTIASPRVALMFSPRENLDVRASVARGFRAPQVFDEDLHLSSVAGEARLMRISPGLRHETSLNTMGGVEWKPVVGRGQALVEFNAFSTALDDLFHVVEDDNPATQEFEFTRSNFGTAAVYGFELNLGWGIEDRLIFQGGLVEQRARFDRPEPDFGSRDFFRTPRRYGNLTATIKHPAVGDVFVGLRFTGSMTAPHYAGFIAEDRLEVTPSFVTMDVTLARPIAVSADRQVVLTLALRNLTDAYQRDLDQGPLRDAAYLYGPRFPRSVSLGMRVEF